MLDIEWPEDIGSARLVGRIGYLLADNEDEDRDPNIRAAVEGQVIVTPAAREIKYEGSMGTMLLYPKPTVGVINNEGYLFTSDKDGNPTEPGLVVAASDTPVIQPYDYSYRILIKVPGHDDKEYNIAVKPNEVVDLATATPVGSLPGTIKLIDRDTAIRAENAARTAEMAAGGAQTTLRTVEEHASNTKTSETNAKTSETNAGASAKSSATSASESKESATKSEKSNKDAREVWSEIMDTVSRGGSFFIQDDPPPPGATYEWDGQERNSQSTKRVDGETVAYNLVQSPRDITSGYSTIRADINSVNHYLGNEIVATEGRDFYARFISYGITAQGFVSAGFTFDWGVGVEEVQLLLQMRNADGVITQRTRDLTKSDFPGGTRVIDSLEVPQSATVFYAYVYVAGSQVGASVIAGHFSASIAATEEEALQHVETFFDGDTPDEVEDVVWVNRDLEIRYWIDGQWQLT